MNCFCPSCKSTINEFLPFKNQKGRFRKNVKCPICGSGERHRLSALYLDSITPIKPNSKVLHFAPEKSIAPILKKQPDVNYLSVDINPTEGSKKEDINKLSFENCSFDFIHCFCVLTEISDYKVGVRELYRVMSHGGIGMIVTTDNQYDYFKEIGFETKLIKSGDVTAPESFQRYGIHPNTLFLLIKKP